MESKEGGRKKMTESVSPKMVGLSGLPLLGGSEKGSFYNDSFQCNSVTLFIGSLI